MHLGAYSLSKIVGEAVVRFAAGQAGSPLTIIRIFRTYGPEGGTPVNRLRRILRGDEIVLYPDVPNNYNPIYEDDYVRLAVPRARGGPRTIRSWSTSPAARP